MKVPKWTGTDEFASPFALKQFLKNREFILLRRLNKVPARRKQEQNHATTNFPHRICPVCKKKDRLTDGKHNGEWIKMCQKCYFKTIL